MNTPQLLRETANMLDARALSDKAMAALAESLRAIADEVSRGDRVSDDTSAQLHDLREELATVRDRLRV